MSDYNIRDDIVSRAAENLATQIDFEILTNLLIQSGWTKVVLTPMTWETSDAIDFWVMKNCRGNHQTMGLVWVFERPEDATWFTLRWAQ